MLALLDGNLVGSHLFIIVTIFSSFVTHGIISGSSCSSFRIVSRMITAVSVGIRFRCGAGPVWIACRVRFSRL